MTQAEGKLCTEAAHECPCCNAGSSLTYSTRANCYWFIQYCFWPASRVQGSGICVTICHSGCKIPFCWTLSTQWGGWMMRSPSRGDLIDQLLFVMSWYSVIQSCIQKRQITSSADAEVVSLIYYLVPWQTASVSSRSCWGFWSSFGFSTAGVHGKFWRCDKSWQEGAVGV